jgi:hypothetical protein
MIMRLLAEKAYLTVSMVLLVLFAPNAAMAGTQLLGTPVETNTDITATGDELRVTIPSTGDKGGNDATTATVSLSGTGLNVSDVASVAVFYDGLEAGRVTPGALINIPISLPGNEKGGFDWTFYVNFNTGANVTNFVFTVEGIAGTDGANLPFWTSGATVNISAGNSPPVLTISQPDGVGDSVTAGASYNIDYDLTDADFGCGRYADHRLPGPIRRSRRTLFMEYDRPERRLLGIRHSPGPGKWFSTCCVFSWCAYSYSFCQHSSDPYNYRA